MKKSLLKIGIIMLSIISITSCATMMPSNGGMQTSGAFYTGYTDSKIATSNTVGSKVGTASSTNVLGLVTVGDGGVQEAAKDAGITKISHVDTKVSDVLGLYRKVTTIVYGE